MIFHQRLTHKNSDSLEQSRAQLFHRAVVLWIDQLHLQPRKERLHHRVVPAVALAAHTRHDAKIIERLLILVAPVLYPAIGMQQQSLRDVSACACHRQRLHNERLAHVCVQRPSNHLAREQIQHHRQVRPASTDLDIGDVRDPFPVRPFALEIPRQDVLLNLRRRLHRLFVAETLAIERSQAACSQQLRHVVWTAADPQGVQLLGQSRRPVATFAPIVGLLEHLAHDLSTLGLSAGLALQPRIEPRSRYRQHAAHQHHRELSPTSRHEGVLHLSVFAKYAVAFFRKSRSSSNSAIRFLSRRTSSDSVFA